MSKDDHCVYPGKGVCPICGTSFSESHGLAYISCGALPIADSEDSSGDSGAEAFFSIGYHGDDAEVIRSVDAMIVDDLKSDQFDIQMCSLSCLRKWLNWILDGLERDLASRSEYFAARMRSGCTPPTPGKGEKH